MLQGREADDSARTQGGRAFADHDPEPRGAPELRGPRRSDPGRSDPPTSDPEKPGTGPDDRPSGPGEAAAPGGGAAEDKRGKLERIRDFVRRHPWGTAIAALLLVGAIVAGILYYLNARHFEATDDAFIDARVFSIAPKVSGYLVAVPVTDNQHVEAGAVLARVDTRDYDAALDQANAQVAGGEASVQSANAQIEAQQSQIAEARAQVVQSEASGQFAADENRRAQELVQKGAGTAQRAQQTASELVQAQATLARSRAALNSTLRQVAVLEGQKKSSEAQLAQAMSQRAQAQLNLSYTTVTAEQSGRVARLTGAKGQLVQAGQALSMFVPDDLWVTANYKETQLTDMRPGQEVAMTIDAYPDRVVRGRVDSIQRGSGTVFSLLPAQNATGNYVKVVQRVPVKLVFDDIPRDLAVGPGMSVVPKVRVR